LTNQLTAEFPVPVTAALNAWLWLAARLTLEGVTLTVTVETGAESTGFEEVVVFADVFDVVPQPVTKTILRRTVTPSAKAADLT
jgi:hypothetical protein